ncbi:MAG: FAD-dependent oxidoreductase, partial [Gammaproteobacteria bacterium]|nr:FAD-dependent oxidoreductase [Gammaproteobacteria bacterium]
MQTFDAIVIGAGQAGPSLTGRLAGAGMRVALIERGAFGGTCVNNGCTPTKALIASAQLARALQRAGEYGLRAPAGAAIDMPRVKARKDAVVSGSREALERWLRSLTNVTLLRGHARFSAAHILELEGAMLSAPRI